MSTIIIDQQTQKMIEQSKKVKSCQVMYYRLCFFCNRINTYRTDRDGNPKCVICERSDGS